MKYFFCSVFLFLIAGCDNYKNEGLYTGKKFISTTKDVDFCSVIPPGGGNIMAITALAGRNTAVRADPSKVIEISVEEFKDLKLNYDIAGELKLFFGGAEISHYKKKGWKPFESPCNSDDNVINFLLPVKTPFETVRTSELSSFSFQEQTIDWLSKLASGELEHDLYEGGSLYVLIFDAVSGRKTDKGWVFKVNRGSV